MTGQVGTPTVLRLGTPAGRWVVTGMVLGSAVTYLNQGVVNVALPEIADDLDVGTTGVQWISNAYLLPLAALILVAGSVGDLLGRARVFVAGAALLGAATLVCAVAPNLGVLLAGRVAQGVGAAAMTPASLAIIDASFGEEERSRAIAAWASGSALASAAGPFVGGALIDSLGWRWVFLVSVPLTVAAAWAAARHVDDPPAQPGARALVDRRGATWSAVAITGLVVALVQGPSSGWSSPLVVAAAAAALVGAVLFAVVERRTPRPLVPARLFASRQFTGANVMTLLAYFGLSGAFFFTAIAFQTTVGWSATAAGAALVPASAVMIVLSPRVGAWAGTVGPRWFVTGGTLLIAASFVWLAALDEDSTYLADVLPPALVLGVGMGAMVPTLTAGVLAAVPAADAGVGSAVNNAAARTSGLLAIAALPALVGAGDGEGISDVYGRAMLVCAAACVAGAAVAAVTIGRCRATHTTLAPSPLAGCSQRSLPVAD